MDGRQIENVEAQVADGGQPSDDIVESTVALRRLRGRSGEQFVPRGEPRLRALNIDRDGRSVAI